MQKIIRVLLGIIIASVPAAALSVAIFDNSNIPVDEYEYTKICDGTLVTTSCIDENGTKYKTYIWHEAEPETVEYKYHKAEPAITHIEHHDAIYGYKTTKECIKTTISNNSGTCALSKCRDGKYSGSSGKGTCSHHGGVLYGGGPWYETKTVPYIITPEWDEVVTDVPAKEAWTEKIILAPAKEAYLESVLLEEIQESVNS